MVMPFGKHRGQAIAELPTGYLEWLSTLQLRSNELRFAVKVELLRRREEQGADLQIVLHIPQRDLEPMHEIIARGRRAAARVQHPDVGGDGETMRRINVIADALLAQIEELAS